MQFKEYPFTQQCSKIMSNIKVLPKNHAENAATLCQHLREQKENGNNNALIFSKKCKLQSYYLATQPFYLNFMHNEPSINPNNYPIVGVVAFSNGQYHQINYKLSQWIQSGGTRCIPLKCSDDYNRIIYVLSNCHSLIIPQFKHRLNAEEQNFMKLVANFLSKHNMPMLALGNSANLFIRKWLQLQLELSCKLFKQTNGAMVEAYIDKSQGKLMHSLNCNISLAVQNKKTLNVSQEGLVWQAFHGDEFKKIRLLNGQGIEVQGVFREQSGKWMISLAKSELFPWYFSYTNPANFSNSDSISFEHFLINSFLEYARKQDKKVKHIKLIGQYELMMKGTEKENVDSKIMHYKIV